MAAPVEGDPPARFYRLSLSSPAMAESVDALRELAASLRDEGSLISGHVREPDGLEAGLGELAAAGERAAEQPGAYAVIIESVHEGYLLHYASARLIVGVDDDLSLLAGDYLYALGLDRLARLGDLEAVRELSDLITLSAQIHSEPERSRDRASRELAGLWLASSLSVGAGGDRRHELGKSALRIADAS